MKRMCSLCGEIKDWPEPTAHCPQCATLTCTPRITVRQLHRRGACLDQVTRFRMRFGKEVEVTVEACVEACHDFDFEWATTELLHEPHCEAVELAVNARQEEWAGDGAKYDRVLAEEFAKKYREAYPNVP